MSIAIALSNALSGLTASARAAELVSANVANVMTEGYARRELVLATQSVGGAGRGVSVTGITRVVDQVLLSDRRVADAAVGDRATRADFFTRLEAALGTPDSATSLGARIADLDAALIEAASRPDSEARLANVLGAAQAIVTQIGSVASDIQAARATADNRIAAEVAQLNDALAQVADLNTAILTQNSAGRDGSALMDQRQQLIDQIAAIVPLREVARDHGQIALYTTGGAQLLDGHPAVFAFTPVGLITADMSLAAGSLSGLTLNGQPTATAGAASMIGGGALAAQFAVRDDLAPEAQARLDAVARDLVGRFADPALDATRAPGDPGLFTDVGAAFDPANEVGLAQRLMVSSLVDPAQGGALWRLRDGLGAAAVGPPGNSTLLTALQSALIAPRQPVSGGFMAGARSFSALATDLLSGVASARLGAEAEASFASAKADTLKQQELENGVDTDQEMQKLLLIEQAYSASAKVVQTVDDMIKILLGM
ncbi:MAG: flagellar hook-associated protein FlgK [Rhodobacteraceae bacterium CG2_30_10_405]|nr:flagellar hook-associated protein FlgK [Alphaproteobacteria bacterium]OIQ06391.1 MAG: flagellar hook-associated protein FlgK [Rhodobacteraceae bacterium CG2_30_10_405]